MVEDGYEFFAKRQLVTLFSAPNYCGEFDNAGAMMSVDETLMCSFQVFHITCYDATSTYYAVRLFNVTVAIFILCLSRTTVSNNLTADCQILLKFDTWVHYTAVERGCKNQGFYFF